MKITSSIIACFLFLSVSGKDTYDVQETIQFAHQQLAFPLINHIFFCPDYDIKMLLVGLINAERFAIGAALYQLTDPDIAQALIAARARGVRVEIILDYRGAQEKRCKAALLRKHNVSIYVGKPKMYAIMHNKIFLFSRNIYGKSLAWSGSANATISGMTRNDENVFITQSGLIIRSCKEKLSLLKQAAMGKPRKMGNSRSVSKNCASLLQFLLSWNLGYASF